MRLLKNSAKIARVYDGIANEYFALIRIGGIMCVNESNVKKRRTIILAFWRNIRIIIYFWFHFLLYKYKA